MADEGNGTVASFRGGACCMRSRRGVMDGFFGTVLASGHG